MLQTPEYLMLRCCCPETAFPQQSLHGLVSRLCLEGATIRLKHRGASGNQHLQDENVAKTITVLNFGEMGLAVAASGA